MLQMIYNFIFGHENFVIFLKRKEYHTIFGPCSFPVFDFSCFQSLAELRFEIDKCDDKIQKQRVIKVIFDSKCMKIAFESANEHTL